MAAELFPADGQTDMKNLTVVFRKANAPKTARLQGSRDKLKKRKE